MIEEMMRTTLAGDGGCQAKFKIPCKELGAFEMYDPSNDPLEEKNLAANCGKPDGSCPLKVTKMLDDLTALRKKKRLSPPPFPETAAGNPNLQTASTATEEDLVEEQLKNPDGRISIG